MDEWKVCWKVNFSFQEKQKSQQSCVACGKLEESGCYLSTFIKDVASCRKHHGWERTGLVCTECDRDMVLNITLRKQKCFAEGCELILNIDSQAVSRKVKDELLLKAYLNLIAKYRVNTCTVCYCAEPLENFPDRVPTVNCDHEINACRDCLGDLLGNAVASGQWQRIQCPETSCKEILGGADVQAFGPRDVFERYEELIALKHMSSLPNFTWCAGNGHKCGSGQIVPDGENNLRWKCQKCSETNCFKCRSLDHYSKTCVEYQRESELDPETLKLLYSTTKACPNRNCRKRITKDELCKDMHCKSEAGGCDLTFCWNYKIVYRLGITAHLRDCRFAGSKIVQKPDKGGILYVEHWDKDPDYVPSPHEYRMGFERRRAEG